MWTLVTPTFQDFPIPSSAASSRVVGPCHRLVHHHTFTHGSQLSAGGTSLRLTRQQNPGFPLRSFNTGGLPQQEILRPCMLRRNCTNKSHKLASLSLKSEFYLGQRCKPKLNWLLNDFHLPLLMKHDKGKHWEPKYSEDQGYQSLSILHSVIRPRFMFINQRDTNILNLLLTALAQKSQMSFFKTNDHFVVWFGVLFVPLLSLTQNKPLHRTVHEGELWRLISILKLL